MNTKYLPEIKLDGELVVAKVTIEQLQSEGLEFDDNYEILDSFKPIRLPVVKGEHVNHLDITRSNGYYGFLQIHLGIMSRVDSNENVHISQEIALSHLDTRLQFCCPLDDGGEILCSELYLRADFPLFGSAESLNMG